MHVSDDYFSLIATADVPNMKKLVLSVVHQLTDIPYTMVASVWIIKLESSRATCGASIAVLEQICDC